ncbi:MAG: DUF3488 and transglutaminase-like domain-containing protein [Sulfurovum sp.]|nr:DUF3488 and transglutaminase-like domain-containing protein [Sulfurovum sp.]
MKFLNTLQNTKFSSLALLDISYIVVLLPLLLMLKIPMLFFVGVIIAILIFKSTPLKSIGILFIFMLGMLALYLSLYGAFSFRGLSRLKLFLELLVYILIIVVAMQRLTREINFYLLISPFLFLALSLFFYYGMLMLIYIIFELFLLLWMILSHRMGGDIKEGFASSMVMFMYSLPWVVVLFIFFPRISFEHANYGFRGETIQRMGHDGTMYLDSNALLVPSERIVMEVGFEKEIPPAHTLYFRGSILYIDKKDHWEGLAINAKRETKPFYATTGLPIKYQVTLYPTQKKWLYALDMPSKNIKNSILDRDLISTVEKSIKEPLHYSANSSLSAKFYDILDEETFKASSTFESDHNPRTYTKAQKLQKSYPDIEKRAKALKHFFKAQNLTYTLKPDALDINHTTDSFLFDTRRGYCVHFASSFVTMARMAGIPARIVTGYKADFINGLKNYLPVKEKDAHAWAELYINDYWVRFEATATASFVEEDNQEVHSSSFLSKEVNLYLMYVKYQVETWILHYSHIRQLQLLEYAKNNPTFVAIFVMSLITLLLLTFVIISYFKRPYYSSKTLATMQALLKRLKKEKYLREDEETLHQYLIRYAYKHPKKTLIYDIDKLYEHIIYANENSKNKQKELKILIKKFLKE